MKWPWSRDRSAEVRATIATSAVKAQALALVDELRSSLDRLEDLVRENPEVIGQNGGSTTR